MEGDATSGCGEDTGGCLRTSGRNSGLFRGNKGTARCQKEGWQQE